MCVCAWGEGVRIPNQWCKTEPLWGWQGEKTLINATGCLSERWKGRKRERAGGERERERGGRIRAWEGSRRIRESVQCPVEKFWGWNISQLTSVCVQGQAVVVLVVGRGWGNWWSVAGACVSAGVLEICYVTSYLGGKERPGSEQGKRRRREEECNEWRKKRGISPLSFLLSVWGMSEYV